MHEQVRTKRGLRPDRAIAALANRQHSVVAWWQLLALGIGRGAIEHRVKAGRLVRLHRGVYLVGGGTLTRRAREVAAVLAYAKPPIDTGRRMALGDLSPSPMSVVLSHRSAAAFWEFLPYPASADVCITVPGRRPDALTGTTLHQTTTLERRDVVVRDSIPVTTPARTLIDIAGKASDDDLEQAVAVAYDQRRVSERQLREQIRRNPRRAGTGALRALLDRAGDPALTRSRAERKLLRLIRGARLPEPEANAMVEGQEVDLVWRQQRLAVEFDSWRFHSNPRAFRRDRERTNALQLRGYTVLRFTWRQLTERPDEIVDQVRAALRATRSA